MSQPGRLHLTLTDTAPQVADALEAAVEEAGLADVEVVGGSLFDVGADAVVSPGNSFGFMDGGLDLACVDRFGLQVEDRVRAAIRDRFHGELLVGQAVTVPTDDEALPWLISAPTMRVPMRLPADTVNSYLAMRAALLAVLEDLLPASDEHRIPARQGIFRLAVPGLGTGTGRVPPTVVAGQMVAAIRHVRDGDRPTTPTWDAAVAAHRQLIAARR